MKHKRKQQEHLAALLLFESYDLGRCLIKA